MLFGLKEICAQSYCAGCVEDCAEHTERPPCPSVLSIFFREEKERAGGWVSGFFFVVVGYPACGHVDKNNEAQIFFPPTICRFGFRTFLWPESLGETFVDWLKIHFRKGKKRENLTGQMEEGEETG